MAVASATAVLIFIGARVRIYVMWFSSPYTLEIRAYVYISLVLIALVLKLLIILALTLLSNTA